MVNEGGSSAELTTTVLFPMMIASPIDIGSHTEPSRRSPIQEPFVDSRSRICMPE
jgi:hypothetical protein